MMPNQTLDAVRLLQSNNRPSTAVIKRSTTKYEKGGTVDLPSDDIIYKVRVWHPKTGGQETTNPGSRIEASDIWMVGFPIEAVVKVTDEIVLDDTITLEVTSVANLGATRSYLRVTCIRRGSRN